MPIGAYARQWVNTVNPARPAHVAAVDRGGSAASFAALPLDYFASGPRLLFTRNQWGSLATSLLLQLGVTADEGHQHNDVGTWQMWRNGRWLSRETTGYAQDIVGFGGGQVDTNNAAAHNSLFVGTQGPASGWRVGQSTVRRAREPAGLLVRQRRSHPGLPRDAAVELDNAAVSHVEREFIFLKPIETLVIFDRVESTQRLAGQDVPRALRDQPDGRSGQPRRHRRERHAGACG